MEQPFRSLVTSDVWRREVEAWIHDRAQEADRRLSGPIEQLRVRPWSTQLAVSTDRGRLWFKANSESMRFEAALHDLLARVVPEDVTAPLAVDPDRGWVLTADRGATLGDTREPGLEDWRDLVRSTARLQRVLADHGDAVLATGVPDGSPQTVPARLEQVLERLAGLAPSHPSHLDEERRGALERCRPQIADAAQALAESPIPVTLQHGDLHPWNAFADLRVFDFGDAQWAAAPEVLQVPYGWITRRTDLPWTAVRDAYLEQWEDVIDHRSLRTLVEASVFTHAVNRATTWLDALRDAGPDDLAAWGDGALRTITRVIEA